MRRRRTDYVLYEVIMSDVIHLLPDNVANQIAAGEVVQRPASVIKELVENSIDAGATSVKIIIKDAGRTLIQVIDDGKGMSETDARLCFERHATSKISSANDLFALHTMGFRGEALPSIASVSQLELRTKRKEDEIGTLVEMAGGKIERQETTACQDGTNIMVKNLFFNVPARRKFLKTNSTEFNHIEKEFFRIALVNPQTAFALYHNDQMVYQLKQGPLRERIVSVFGKPENAKLLVVDVNSTMVKIGGYVGKPETAKKQNEHQYFFVNGRYMRHPYFHKAIMVAFERLVPAGTSPDYFIYFEVDPANIDVNIHPTKTEIKFENEQPIWTILLAGVKEALGKFNITPSLDFEHGSDVFDNAIPLGGSHKKEPMLSVPTNVDSSYNPFKTSGQGGLGYQSPKKEYSTLNNWQSLYSDFENEGKNMLSPEKDAFRPTTLWDDVTTPFSTPNSFQPPIEADDLNLTGEENKTHYIQMKSKYILTMMKSGLVCIDQHRAHVKVLYERFSQNLQRRKAASQRLMFPIMLNMLESDAMMLDEISEDLQSLGFELSNLGGGAFAIIGIPADCKESEAEVYIKDLLTDLRNGTATEDRLSAMAMKLAEYSAIKAGRILNETEMMELVSQLFSLPSPNYTGDNRKVLHLFTLEDIEKHFK